MKRIIVLVVICLTVNKLQAQDTLRTLTETDFLAVVKAHHPVAKQAGLLVDLARAQLLSIPWKF